MQKGKREHVTVTAHIAPSSSAETDRSANATAAGEGVRVAQPAMGRRLAGGSEGLPATQRDFVFTRW